VGLYEAIETWQRLGLEDDVHELINWYHAGVVLQLEALQTWCDRGDFEQVKVSLPRLVERARTTLFELKTIHTAIFSRYLEMDTIEGALHRIASAWRVRASFPKPIDDIRIDIKDDLPASVRNVLLRIAALAIGNAVLHSGVESRPNGRIWIRLEQDPSGAVLLEVGDNGKGFDVKRQGYGIGRMQQLVRQMGGRLEIRTGPNRGTRVIAWLPLTDG